MISEIKIYRFNYYKDAETWLDLNYGIAIGREYLTDKEYFIHVLISNKLSKAHLSLLMEFLKEPKQVASKGGHTNYLCKTSQLSLQRLLLDYNFTFVN